MPKRRLVWHLFPAFGLLALAAAVLLGWAGLHVLEASLVDASRRELLGQADYLDALLGPDVPPDRAEFGRQLRWLEQAAGVRTTLILASGSVDRDSRGRPEEFENQTGRPEIATALHGEAADAVRYNPGLDQRVLYLAVPIYRHDELFCVREAESLDRRAGARAAR